MNKATKHRTCFFYHLTILSVSMVMNVVFAFPSPSTYVLLVDDIENIAVVENSAEPEEREENKEPEKEEETKEMEEYTLFGALDCDHLRGSCSDLYFHRNSGNNALSIDVATPPPERAS